MPSQQVLEEKVGEVEEIKAITERIQVHRSRQPAEGSRCAAPRVEEKLGRQSLHESLKKHADENSH